MRARFLMLALISGVLWGALLFANDISGPVNPPSFLTPDEIDPYVFQVHMGVVVPPASYISGGNAAYQQQQYEDAARYYLAHLQYEPTNKNVLYNLSRCYGMLDKPDLAAKYVALAYTCGFTNIKHIDKDKGFNKVRSTPVFQTTMDSLRMVNKKAQN